MVADVCADSNVRNISVVPVSIVIFFLFHLHIDQLQLECLEAIGCKLVIQMYSGTTG